MARLGGMSTESFSSARECLSAASVGLGAILRDQKTMPSSSRSNVLLGLSTQLTTPAAARSLSNSPVHSLATSPIESSGFLDTDEPDDYKEEDICAADMRESRNSQSLGHTRSASHGYDLWNHGTYDPTFRHGFSHAHTHTPIHAHQQRQCRPHHDSPKQKMYAVNGMRPAQNRAMDNGVGLSDAIMTSAAAVRLSPLSKVSDSQAHHTPAWKTSTPSWTIPGAEIRTSYDVTCHSKHQSAPVNVPNRSKILQQQQVSRGRSTDEIGEDDAERIPPHELVAKEYAQNQMMTSSVCEGQGRTLKGRDMRRMRNAVWRQTGFAD